MRFEFQLHDDTVISDLLHELNLHEHVHAQLEDHAGTSDVIVVVALPDLARLVWSVRSSVNLFDPRAVELAGGQRR